MPDEGARDNPLDLRKLFEVWVDSDLKAQIILFYNNNPGVVETMEGLAKRLGTNVENLRQDIAAHVELGLVKERQLGDKTVLVYDRNRRNDIESFITEQLRNKLGDVA
jgi:hypothetical protein